MPAYQPTADQFGAFRDDTYDGPIAQVNLLKFRDKAPVNTFHLPDLENHRLVGGDPNIRMFLGRWELGPDEALVIDATPPNCHYWNFQLGNIWAESLDYDFRQVHVNSGQAKYRDDGSFRLDLSYFNYCQGLRMTSKKFARLFDDREARESHAFFDVVVD